MLTHYTKGTQSRNRRSTDCSFNYLNAFNSARSAWCSFNLPSQYYYVIIHSVNRALEVDLCIQRKDSTYLNMGLAVLSYSVRTSSVHLVHSSAHSGAHRYRLFFARRYKTNSLLCSTAAKKMFQLTAFVKMACNFSQNTVNFIIGCTTLGVIFVRIMRLSARAVFTETG